MSRRRWPASRAARPPNRVHLALFLIGAVAMRGAGSTYNDILDRESTRGSSAPAGGRCPRGASARRPPPRLPRRQALVGLAALLGFNRFAIALGLGSLAIVAIYPLMKRVTVLAAGGPRPRLLVGRADGLGGGLWLARRPALLLYASAFCWTIGYDTIYALQDARDDAIVGIGSTARLFGAQVRAASAAFYLAAALLAELAVFSAGGRILAQLGMCGYGLHLAWQLRRVDGATPATALRLFRSNRDAGLIMFAGLALDGLASRLLS